MQTSMTNEFGEEILIEKVYDLADRIRIFTDEQLDELWFSLRFIYSDREPEYKALAQVYMNRIHSGVWCAMSVVENLLLETKLADVEKEVRIIEKREGYR